MQDGVRKKRSWVKRARVRAKKLKRRIAALVLALRDPRTPWYAKLCGFAVVAYAVSPIDLIPDFIPVLGFLDDAILLPLGILATIRMIPRPVFLSALREVSKGGPSSAGRLRWAGATGIILVWLLIALLIVRLLWR